MADLDPYTKVQNTISALSSRLWGLMDSIGEDDDPGKLKTQVDSLKTMLDSLSALVDEMRSAGSSAPVAAAAPDSAAPDLPMQDEEMTKAQFAKFAKWQLLKIATETDGAKKLARAKALHKSVRTAKDNFTDTTTSAKIPVTEAMPTSVDGDIKRLASQVTNSSVFENPEDLMRTVTNTASSPSVPSAFEKRLEDIHKAATRPENAPPGKEQPKPAPTSKTDDFTWPEDLASDSTVEPTWGKDSSA